MNRVEVAPSVRAVILADIQRRPTYELPDECNISMVDNGRVDRWATHRVHATFIAGKWVRTKGRNLPVEPARRLKCKQ